MMAKRARLARFLGFFLLLTVAACGGGGSDDDSVVDPSLDPAVQILLDKLQGVWLSDDLNSAGEHTRLTFTVDTLGKRHVKVEATKEVSTQTLVSALSQGSFSLTTDKIIFDFESGEDLTSSYSFSGEQLVVDGKNYSREATAEQAAAGEGSGVITGQIRIDDGSGEGGAPSLGAASALTSSDLAGLALQESALLPLADSKFIQSFTPASLAKEEFTTQRMKIQVAEPGAVNDPLYTQGALWWLKSINAPGGWSVADLFEGSHQETVVAVIDTGKIPATAGIPHEDLSGRWTGGYDFIKAPFTRADGTVAENPGGDGNSLDPDPTDEGDNFYAGNCADAQGINCHSWHGGHLAGIVAAKRNNAVGIAGISPFTKVLPLRVAGEEGASIDDIINAIKYAAGLINVDAAGATSDAALNAPTRADVINLSLGCFVPTTEFYNSNVIPAGISICGHGNIALAQENATNPLFMAIQQALSKGVIVTAAAGNCNLYPPLCSQAFYPAEYTGVIKVGGIKSDGKFWETGSVINNDFVAPSGSTEPCESLGMNPQVWSTVWGGYACRSGTSQAAPMVAATIALMKALDTELTRGEAYEILATTALDLGTEGFDELYGNGLIQVREALLETLTRAGVDTATLELPAARLELSETELNYGQTKNEKVVFVQNGGGDTLDAISAASSVPWLTVAVSRVEAPALITLTVNRTGLTAGTYQTTVTVASSAGSQDIAVSMSVPNLPAAPAPPAPPDDGTEGGDGDSGGDDGEEGSQSLDEWLEDLENLFAPSYDNEVDIGKVHVMLIRVNPAEGESPVAGAVETSLGINYQFEFKNIPDGEYYVIAGVASDSQPPQLCNRVNFPNLPCTAFPNYDTPQILTIEGGNTVSNVVLDL